MISKRQKQVLDYVSEFIETHGYSPTVREIGKGVGLYSSSTVQGHLGVLKARGYITSVESTPRTIRVLKK